MEIQIDVLQLRILIWFLNVEEDDCNVTALSKALNKEKYQISRLLGHLEKQGLINREDVRHPCLTGDGMKWAKYYQERLDLTISHLIYEGVDIEHARNDAYYWALYNSDETMKVIRAMDEKYRIKNHFRMKEKFSGAELARIISNGIYQMQFLINREHSEVGKTVSMGNNAFEHPCVLAVKNKTGNIQLRSVPIKAFSPSSHSYMEGKAKSVKYFQDGDYHQAEFVSDVIIIPLEAFQFYSNGIGPDQIIYGSIMLKLQASVGNVHMPESKAIMTVLL